MPGFGPRVGIAAPLVMLMIVGLAGCSLGSDPPDQESPSHEISRAFLDPGGTGWVVDAQGRLFVTPDAGDTWTELSPPVSPAGVGMDGNEIVVANVETLNVKDWEAGHEIQIASSRDRGESWTVDRVTLAGVPANAPVVAVHDATVAILVPWQTSSNFSRGTLVFAADGKQWKEQEAPVAGKLAFVSADELWLAGGVSSSELYRTANGGEDWQAVALPKVADFFSLDTPVAVSANRRELMLTISGDQPAAALMASDDYGLTWAQEQSVAIPGPIEIGVRLPAVRDAEAWLVASPHSATIVSIGTQGSKSQESAQGLLGPIMEWSTTKTGVGWAAVFVADCPSKLNCTSTTILMRTQNAGAGWESLGT